MNCKCKSTPHKVWCDAPHPPVVDEGKYKAGPIVDSVLAEALESSGGIAFEMPILHDELGKALRAAFTAGWNAGYEAGRLAAQQGENAK